MSERSAGSADRSHFANLSKEAQQRADALCDQFEAQWRAGPPPRIEDFLAKVAVAERRALLQELVQLDIAYRRQRGAAPQAAEYHQRFPVLDLGWLQRLLTPRTIADSASSSIRMVLENSAAIDPAELPALGDYQLLDCLGEGGMGVVFRARHTRMDRIVAIKMVRPETLGEAVTVGRFEREIRLISQLAHPNIVAALDAGEADGIPYLVMEYVEGADLASVVAQQGPLPVERAVNYVLQAAAGLLHAHERGLVHRDIKPHNLLLTRQGVVKVLDLGLARMIGAESKVEGQGASYRTQSGTVLGTFHYMAPEQALNSRNADRRSDVYSLGCTLYYLLAGNPIYSGETGIEVFLAHVQSPVASLRQLRPDVPVALDRVFQRSVAKQPEKRYQSLADLITDLQKATGTTVAALLPSALPATAVGGGRTQFLSTQMLPARRSKRAWIVGSGALALALVLLVALIVGWQFAGPAKAPGTPPAAATTFTNHLGMRFRRLPADTFLMGNSPQFIQTMSDRLRQAPRFSNRLGDFERELPERSVRIERPFFMAETEVTNAQFEAFAQATNYITDAEQRGNGWGIDARGQWSQGRPYSWRNQGQQPRTPEHPAVSVSWNDAMRFCEWLTGEERRLGTAGVTYRLPTEAEWEYGCRAGSSQPWGSTPPEQLSDFAWYEANAGNRIQPVGRTKPNAWGLHDMLGNEMEWCLDRYGDDLRDSEPRQDARDPGSRERRAQRGGAFGDPAEFVRPACRRVTHPTSPTHGAFRVVRIVE